MKIGNEEDAICKIKQFRCLHGLIVVCELYAVHIVEL